MPAADPAHYVRGQYDGYRETDGVAADSTTETYAALRLEIDNWRWSGVPFFIRTGKHLPDHPDRAAARLQATRRGSASARRSRRPEPDQLVVKLDPTTGIRLLVDAQRADADEARADQPGHGVRRSRAARAPRRTRCCCTPRWSATASASRDRTASRRPGG